MNIYDKRSIEILTEGKKEKERELQELFNSSVCDVIAIQEYRKQQIKAERGQDIIRDDFILLNNLEVEYMQEVLEEMFLEPVFPDHISYFYESATKRGYNDMNTAFAELYRRHMQEPGTRFLSIALTI